MNQPDYVLPNSKVLSPPQIVSFLAHPCPRCQCSLTCKVQVRVAQELLKGGQGNGTYIGCAACGWASPMAIHADGGNDGN